MSEKKSIPRIELIIIVLFFVSFVLWAMRKCSEAKKRYVDEITTEEPIDSSILQEQEPVVEKPVEPDKPKPETRPLSRLEQARLEQNGGQASSDAASTRLYITIDNLNMRDAPNLKGKIIDKLKLFDEVNFMNEVTDSTTKLSLGKVMADEPWVKIRNRQGQVGWVYGAGVSYYKKKREGVQ